MPTHKQIVRHCQQAGIGPYARTMRAQLSAASTAADPEREAAIRQKVIVRPLEMKVSGEAVRFGFMVDIDDRSFRAIFRDPDTADGADCAKILEWNYAGSSFDPVTGPDATRAINAVVASIPVDDSVRFAPVIRRLRDAAGGKAPVCPPPALPPGSFYMDRERTDLDRNAYRDTRIEIDEKIEWLANYIRNDRHTFSFNTRGLRYVLVCENHMIPGKECFFGYGVTTSGNNFSARLNPIEASQAIEHIAAHMTPDQKSRYHLSVIKLREHVKKMALSSGYALPTVAPKP